MARIDVLDARLVPESVDEKVQAQAMVGWERVESNDSCTFVFSAPVNESLRSGVVPVGFSLCVKGLARDAVLRVMRNPQLLLRQLEEIAPELLQPMLWVNDMNADQYYRETVLDELARVLVGDRHGIETVREIVELLLSSAYSLYSAVVSHRDSFRQLALDPHAPGEVTWLEHDCIHPAQDITGKPYRVLEMKTVLAFPNTLPDIVSERLVRDVMSRNERWRIARICAANCHSMPDPDTTCLIRDGAAARLASLVRVGAIDVSEIASVRDAGFLPDRKLIRLKSQGIDISGVK
ncbi:MAG: hypothetical protein HY817_02585 [Candidatus Abawacabacteria bacterium]|nr:hypothetical protein [Candidatus Abawacabacteria bacterium]